MENKKRNENIFIINQFFFHYLLLLLSSSFSTERSLSRDEWNKQTLQMIEDLINC